MRPPMLILVLWLGSTAFGRDDRPPPAPPPPASPQAERPVTTGLEKKSGAAAVTQVETKYKVGPPILGAEPPEKDEIIRSSQSLLDKQLEATGCKTSEPKAVRAVNRWVVSFGLTYRGIPLVSTGGASLLSTADGRAISSRIRNVPERVDATEPRVSAEKARETAEKDFKERTRSKQASSTKPEGPVIWVDPQRAGRLAWDIAVRNDDESHPVVAQYRVSALEPDKVLEVADPIPQGEVTGRITGTTWLAAPPSGTQSRPIPAVKVRIGSVESVSDDQGRFRIVGPDGPAPRVEAKLDGPFFAVRTHIDPAVTASPASGGGSPTDLAFDATTETEIAQVNAMLWAQLAREAAGPQLDGMLPRLQIFVNRVTPFQGIGFGNAYFNPADNTINFFRSAMLSPGDIRQNTATAEIIAHEYGHAIDFAFGGIVDSGLSEACGDMIAVFTTRQPLLGRDIRSDRPAFRDLRARVAFSPFEEVHRQGHSLSGLVWDLTQELQRATPGGPSPMDADEANRYVRDLCLLMIADNPPTIPAALRLIVELDDDDFDLANGTRHTSALRSAAQGRFSAGQLGLPSPSLASGDGATIEFGADVAEDASILTELVRGPGPRVIPTDGGFRPGRTGAIFTSAEARPAPRPPSSGRSLRPAGLERYIESQTVTRPISTAIVPASESSSP